MRSMKVGYFVLALALLAIPLAGCASSSEAVMEAPTEVVLPTETAVPEVAGPTVAATAEAAAAVADTATPEVAEASVQPTPRPGLQATDPDTVALASGSYQLVEFFAFW